MKKITDEQIRKAIKALESQPCESDMVMYVRPADRFLDKTKYRGKGRPRRDDYYWKQINWTESIKGNGMVYL